ncbi:uncharacterized protein PAC_11254 [Phialocephala subalpina]|uniref:Zn(2)-C6 fungal-type domain-containing protein n=1 Tax=Phialocephala subalpina TaxID=576137 RepID=A0A1L7X8J2_9HELO|nr:uncharacterized protein PAC_11254 [Phialocephala subalpina]
MPRQTRRAQRKPSVAVQPRPRTHAFTGCLTCRERHVKCDLGKPSCNNCSRLKVPCEGYARKYSWIPPKFPGQRRRLSDPDPVEEAEESQSSRRADMGTDEEREAMVIQMRDECCSNSSSLDLDRVLRELQDRTPVTNEFSRIGPFGILPLNKESPKNESPPEDVQDVELIARITTPEMNLSLSQFSWGDIDDMETWDALETESAAALVNLRFTPDKDLFNADTPSQWLIPRPTSTGQLDFQNNNDEAEAAENLIQDLVATNDSDKTLVEGTDFDLCLAPWQKPPSIITMSNGDNMSKIPSEARMLLDYYSSKIIDLMSMSPGSKPPWKTIHLPCAMSALAELIVYGEAKSFAKMALFYALLSISSFQIGLRSKDSAETSQYWLEKGNFHKKRSEKYLRSALDTSFPKSSRGKYKEILMTTLSMVTIGVFSGNMQDVHIYLAESESLIRTDGLPKPVKSQKVSKLHHIFSFLKIIHESTSLRGTKPAGVSNSDLWATTTRSALEESNDIAQSASSRLAWVQEDEIEDPEDALFVSIYQLPTTLLSLLSQTSSLCKQLLSSESSTPEFARRCQIIEDRIFRWKAPENLSLKNYFGNSTNPGETASRDAAAKEIAAHLVNATYQALIVHFQRQIRNTNPRVLQHYVITAADHLLAHEQLKQSLKIATAPFPWPGFIVGCEAYDMTARQKIDMYLKLVRCYNVGSLVEAEKVVYEVWRRQDSGQLDKHWEDVLKDWGMEVVLT